MNRTQVSRFSKELLPPAKAFYEQALGRLSRPNRAGWCACRCPFHESKSGKSFAVHIDGAFVCRACGVKGGDVLAFVMLRDRCDFKTAAKSLGAWDEFGKPTVHLARSLVRYLVMDFTIDGVEYRDEILDEPKTELQRMRRLHAEGKDRLTEIGSGDAEQYADEDEEEVQWGILASTGS